VEVEKMRDKALDVSLLLLRLALAIVFIAHGGQKLFGWFGGPGLEGFTGSMAKMGMPTMVATLVAIGEFFGGLGLLVGLLTRVAAIGPIAVMLGAVFLVHLKNGFFLESKGIEYALTLLLVAVAVLIGGPGRYSLDALLHRGREYALPMRPAETLPV
jgi:putative oxidoreductase